MEFFKLCLVLNCVTLILIITSTCENGNGQLADGSWQQEVLSNEKLASLDAVTDIEQKNKLIYYLKKSKHDAKEAKQEVKEIKEALETKKEVIRVLFCEFENTLKNKGFLGYECAFNHIKADLEKKVFDFEFLPSSALTSAENRLLKTSTCVVALENFNAIEISLNPIPVDMNRANKRIPDYFSRMYVILTTEYPSEGPTQYLQQFEVEKNRQYFIKTKLKEYLGKQELTPEDLFDFSFETARLRHASNMFHHAVKDKILKKYEALRMEGVDNMSLEDILCNLKINEAWSLNEKNVHYVNILREYRFHVSDTKNNMYNPIEVYRSESSDGKEVFMLNYPSELCPSVNYIKYDPPMIAIQYNSMQGNLVGHIIPRSTAPRFPAS